MVRNVLVYQNPHFQGEGTRNAMMTTEMSLDEWVYEIAIGNYKQLF